MFFQKLYTRQPENCRARVFSLKLHCRREKPIVAKFRNRWLAWENRFSDTKADYGFSLFHLQTSVRSNGTMCVKRRSNGRWIAVEHGGIIVCINVCVCINSYGSWKLQRPVPCGAGNQFTRAAGMYISKCHDEHLWKWVRKMRRWHMDMFLCSESCTLAVVSHRSYQEQRLNISELAC